MAVIDGILGDEARAIQFPVLPADQPLQRIKPTAEQVAIVEAYLCTSFSRNKKTTK